MSADEVVIWRVAARRDEPPATVELKNAKVEWDEKEQRIEIKAIAGDFKTPSNYLYSVRIPRQQCIRIVSALTDAMLKATVPEQAEQDTADT